MLTPSELFAGQRYKSGHAVLKHVRTLMHGIEPKRVPTSIKKLKEELTKLLERGATQRYAALRRPAQCYTALYALHGLGYSPRQISRTLNLHEKTTGNAINSAYYLLMRKPRTEIGPIHIKKFESAEAFANHILQLSAGIAREEKPLPLPKRKKRPIDFTDFELDVLSATRRHKLGLQVDVRGMTEEFWKDKEKRGDTSTPQELRYKIKKALARLVRKKVLASSMKRIPRLRLTTNAQMQEHAHLVDEALAKSYGMRTTGPLSNKWRKFLTREEAKSAALEGLKNAIETHQPKRGPFEKHAHIQMGSKLADAVRAKLKDQYKRAGKEEELREETTAAPQLTGEKSKDPTSALKLIHSWHEKGILTPREAVVLALRKVFEHEHREISEHLGITESRICQITSAAMKKVKAAHPQFSLQAE
ncbi:MAG: sigma factor-like helix-turn-helix DNA-binding protein [Candidatus Micrarchaeota archaeon]